MSSKKPRSSDRKTVVMLMFPEAQILDVTGPLEVFAIATRMLDAVGRPEQGYAIQLVAPEAGPVAMSSGLQLVAEHDISSVKGSLHTLMVAGGIGTDAQLVDPAVIGWIRRTSKRAERVVSICTGSLLLAEAGLLDGKRATTHWASCERLANDYPKVCVEEDPIFVRDGNVFSSAGVTAGMDLALALVEEDYGRDLALAVARRLVLFLKRPGGQSQFSAQLSSQAADRVPLRDLQTWIVDHPGDDLCVEALAQRVAMSPRNFARVFREEVNMTPARFVERARVEAARRRLQESDASVENIAADCGFGSAETMRRAFLRIVAVGPADYRNRFRSVAA